MFNIEEFRKYLKIDKNSLDDEVSQQPALFFVIGEAFTEAAAERDTLKEDLADIDAELDFEARKNLTPDEGKRPTEAEVKAWIQTHKRHQNAFDAWMKAKKKADKLYALKEAFAQRSYMIRDLCSLFVANYFEGSSVQGTNKTDTATYKRRRELLAESREKRAE